MTLYHCPKCNTRDHYFKEPCLKGEASTQARASELSPQGCSVSDPRANLDDKSRPVVAAPIKQAQEFIMKIGRPKIYADAKVRRRQYMKEYRARKRVGIT